MNCNLHYNKYSSVYMKTDLPSLRVSIQHGPGNLFGAVVQILTNCANIYKIKSTMSDKILPDSISETTLKRTKN